MNFTTAPPAPNTIQNDTKLGIPKELDKLKTLLNESANQKYAFLGSDINCHVKPLSQVLTIEDYRTPLVKSAKFAYAWYVADTKYLCSALTAMQMLQKVRKAEKNSSVDYKVEFVAMYVPRDLKKSADKALLLKWEQSVGVLKRFDNFKDWLKVRYYRYNPVLVYFVYLCF